MKSITSLSTLKNEIQSNDSVWLLLYKKGSVQSNCAFGNFIKSESKADNSVLCHSDVNEVRDIHPEFKISSVPSLVHFEKGELKNVIKGCYTLEQLEAVFTKPSVVTAVNDKKAAKNVTVYTTPTCSWCTTVKRYLNEIGIHYREVNVAADQKAAEEMVKKSGQQGVPQTDINGQVVVGYDKTKINMLLGIN